MALPFVTAYHAAEVCHHKCPSFVCSHPSHSLSSHSSDQTANELDGTLTRDLMRSCLEYFKCTKLSVFANAVGVLSQDKGKERNSKGLKLNKTDANLTPSADKAKYCRKNCRGT